MKEFIHTYTSLNRDNLAQLENIYSKEIHFIDPVHQITGLENLRQYFSALFQNIHTCSFNITHALQSENEGNIQWDMSFSHPKIKHGKEITLSGMSHIKFDEHGLVFYHRDYFDMGAMIYEHLPIFSVFIKMIKRRLSQ